MEIPIARSLRLQVVLDSGQPVISVERVVTQQVAPESNTVEVLKSSGIRFKPWLSAGQPGMQVI